MPFGLKGALYTFQFVMNLILAGLIGKSAVVYLDDINIYSPTFNQHLIDMEEVFKQVDAAKMCLNTEKCFFTQEKLEFLGFVITTKGIEPNPKKIDKVLEWL